MTMGAGLIGRSVCRFGEYELDRTALELRKSGRKIKLAPQPARVLALLASRPGDLVSRDDIRREVWGHQTFVDFDRNLNYCINCIRSVLGDHARAPRYIETLARRGYRFIGDTAQELVPAEQSLAVLPFENLNSDPEQEFLAGSMTDALITQLGKAPSLRVISRQSVLHLKNSRSTVAEIARRLRVGTLVEGSVLRVGDRLRVTAQLIKANPERHLWAESYEHHLDDLLELQTQIARDIAAQIHVIIAPIRKETSPCVRVKPEAHVAYLKGEHHTQTQTAQGLRKALEYYRQAIAIDPTYAAPYAGIAWTYCLLGWWGHLPDSEAYPAAREAALKALSLDQGLSRAHRALHWVRWVYDWDLAETEKEGRRALELNPSDSEFRIQHALFLSVVCRRAAQALAEARVALDLDPLSRSINTMAGWVPLFLGRFDLAMQQARQTLELFPDSLHAWYQLGQCELARNRYSEALAFFQHAAAISQDPITISYVAHAQARAGNRAEAQRVLDLLLAKAQDNYVIPRSLFWVYLGLGDFDRAIRLLEQRFEYRDGFLWWLRSHPAFDPLRSDPRFSALVHRMGFPSDDAGAQG